MLSSDFGIPRRRGRLAPVVLFALAIGGLALSGCQVRPLYSNAPTPSGSTVKTTLTKITIEPVDDRVAQQVRNKLIFGFTGGGAVPDPTYNMKLTVTSNENGLGVTRVEASPSYAVTVSVTYDITKVGYTDVIQHATVTGTASYDRVNQVFANTRAKIDAENRAAEMASEQILGRVAMGFARGTS